MVDGCHGVLEGVVMVCKEAMTMSERVCFGGRRRVIVGECHWGKAGVYGVQSDGNHGHNLAWNPILNLQKSFPKIVCHCQGKQGHLGTWHIEGEGVWHMCHHQCNNQGHAMQCEVV